MLASQFGESQEAGEINMDPLLWKMERLNIFMLEQRTDVPSLFSTPLAHILQMSAKRWKKHIASS